MGAWFLSSQRPLLGHPYTTAFVTVTYKDQEAGFRVPRDYTFHHLLQDTKEFFDVEDGKVELTDCRGAIFPPSASVVNSLYPTHPSDGSTEVFLVKRTDLTSRKDLVKAFRSPTEDGATLPAEHEDELARSLATFPTSPLVHKALKVRRIPTDYIEMALQPFERFLRSRASPRLLSRIESNKDATSILLPRFVAYLKSQRDLFSRMLDMKLSSYMDLRLPHQWYPEARNMNRRIIIHQGPTNSGKTHAALEALKNSRSGVYCAPLRLLAGEIFTRLNEAGLPCSLITGQERQEVPGGQHVSCTVEMANLNRQVDCAVIDEFQMVYDLDRGWAWTRAILGIRAHEVHLCGDGSASDLILRICQDTGESVEIREYKRLTPLLPEDQSLSGSLKKIQEGDCVIAFSRREIFRLQKAIVRATGSGVAVVYGGLPPETRSQQAILFNDTKSKFGILVASDAVGMGLNLNIRRIVFSSLTKFDGYDMRPLYSAEVKQIAGRAGRFKSVHSTGHVTCLKDEDMDHLRKSLCAPRESVPVCGLLPTFEQVEMLAHSFPNKGLADVLGFFAEVARVDGNYFLCSVEDKQAVAELLEPLDLRLEDQYTFSIAPVDTSSRSEMLALYNYARTYSRGQDVGHGIYEEPSLPGTPSALEHLEEQWRILDLYSWLSHRFSYFFHERVSAAEQKVRFSNAINLGLQKHAELRDWRAGIMRVLRGGPRRRRHRSNENMERSKEVRALLEEVLGG